MPKKVCQRCKRYIEHKGKEKYCPNCMKSIYQRNMAPKVGKRNTINKPKIMFKLETEETPVAAPTETPAEETTEEAETEEEKIE